MIRTADDLQALVLSPQDSPALSAKVSSERNRYGLWKILELAEYS